MPNPTLEPALLKAIDFDPSDIGTFQWNRKHNAHQLLVSNHGATVEWKPEPWRLPGVWKRDAVWVPASTHARLHSGSYSWDFIVEEMATRQIGIGFMLLWNVGPDWGFFGYLGASPTAWAYDPYTGDVVCNTASIQGGMPKFADGRTGTVSVILDLPREAAGVARFRIDGVDSKPISLPVGSIIKPAACFLRRTQRVTLAGFKRG